MEKEKLKKPTTRRTRKFKDSRDRQNKGFDKDVPPYKDGKNNPEWRCSDKMMTKLVGSLPFGQPAGLTIDLGQVNPSLTGSYTQSGILNIGVLITAGNASTYNSPLNLAVRKIDSFVRHANSGSRNYQGVDMGMYFVAVGQALAMLGWLQRIRRLVEEYKVTNRYTPLKLLQSMGVNPDDIISNYAQLTYLIAWLGRCIGGLAFPKLPYFEACYEAFKYVYVDNTSPKEQFYILNPRTFGVYSPTLTSAGGGIDYGVLTPFNLNGSGTLETLTGISAMVRAIMNPLQGDEDVGIISGDILKAFSKEGNGGLFIPQAWDDHYEVFLHSPEFLQQVHNLCVLDAGAGALHHYEQNPGSANAAPYMVSTFIHSSSATGAYNLCHRFIIDAFSQEPSPEEVVNCTVLKPQYAMVANTGGTGYIADDATIVFDLYLPVEAYIFTGVNPSTTGVAVTDLVNRHDPITYGYQNVRLTNFDWHPWGFMTYPNGASSVDVILTGDIQNITFQSADVGIRVHENSLLSLFNFKEHNFY